MHKHQSTYLDDFHLKLTEARFSKRTLMIQVLKLSCIVPLNPRHAVAEKSTQNST